MYRQRASRLFSGKPHHVHVNLFIIDAVEAVFVRNDRRGVCLQQVLRHRPHVGRARAVGVKSLIAASRKISGLRTCVLETEIAAAYILPEVGRDFEGSGGLDTGLSHY